MSGRRSSSRTRAPVVVAAHPSPVALPSRQRAASARGSARGHAAAASSSSSTPSHPPSPHATFAEMRLHPEFAHLAENELVHGGYRWRPGWRRQLASLFELHNETLNVCTHLLALIVFVILLVAVLTDHPLAGLERVGHVISDEAHAAADGLRHGVAAAEAAAKRALLPSGASAAALAAAAPVWPLAAFLAGLVMCLACSVAFHLFAPVGIKWWATFARWDYTGITALIFSSSVPPIVYTFSCRHGWRDAYLALALLTNATTAFLCTAERFAVPEWRARRAMAFVATGTMGVIPLIHGCLSAGGPDTPPGEAAAMSRIFWSLISMGGQYFLGAIIYATRVPEALFPGRFDVSLSSHTIFHCLVVTAATTHWFGVRDLWLWRSGHPGVGCVA